MESGVVHKKHARTKMSVLLDIPAFATRSSKITIVLLDALSSRVECLAEFCIGI